MTSGMCYVACNDAERQRLDHLVRKGGLERPAPGVYADATWWHDLNPLEQHVWLAKALAQKHPEWIFCYTTAAAIWGLSLSYARLSTVHVAVPANSHRRNSALVTFHRFASIDVDVRDGVKVTNCVRTALDCMRTLPFSNGLAVADAAIRLNGWDDLCLARRLKEDHLPKLHGLSRAKLVALLADARSESGGESIARANIIRAGFVLPELQFVVDSPTGGRPYRVDFAWLPDQLALSSLSRTDTRSTGSSFQAESKPETYPDHGQQYEHPGYGQSNMHCNPIFGELDGRIKYEDSRMAPTGSLDTLLAERRRESELTLASDAILRLSFAEANSIASLTRKLDAYNIPHICDRLELTENARHSKREIENYLRLNAVANESAAKRMDFIMSSREATR